MKISKKVKNFWKAMKFFEKLLNLNVKLGKQWFGNWKNLELQKSNFQTFTSQFLIEFKKF